MSCFGTLGWSWSQGCALFMKMSASGLNQPGSSRVPAKSDEVWASPDLHVQRRATVTTEDANDVVTAVRFRDIALWYALEDAEPRAGDAGGGTARHRSGVGSRGNGSAE